MSDEVENAATENKYSFLKPVHLMRFPFAFQSMKWGVTIGALLACHKFNRTRDIKSAALMGLGGGAIAASISFLYGFRQFSLEHRIMRQQKFARTQQDMRMQYVKHYFRDKYNLNELNDDQLTQAIGYMD